MKKMKTQKTQTKTGRWAWRMGLVAAGLLLAPGSLMDEAMAQDDPTAIGAGQKPYIVLLVDSSASMEYALENEKDFPCYHRNPDGSGGFRSCDASSSQAPNLTIPGSASYFTWEADNFVGDPANPLDRDYEDPDKGPEFVGPCYVWKKSCNDYARPPWFPGMLKESGSDEKSYGNDMRDRLYDMRGRESPTGTLDPDYTNGRAVRLTDQNQPRHVQLKEILTGDMILNPLQLGGSNVATDFAANPQDHGPGCWFVPRMANTRTAADQWHMCQDLSDPGKWYGSGNKQAFHKMVDFDDPRPHFQEVYDYQLTTGLMDNLANVAIFAVASFDGFGGVIDPTDGTVKPHNAGANDQPIINDGIPNSGASAAYLGGDSSVIMLEDDSSYDLGVYKIVGPTRLDVPSTQLNAISSYAQYAVTDAGYLRNEGKKEWTIDPEEDKNPLQPAFPSGLERYVLPYQMGHQPIARATPLAAAMRDIHMFMINGQVEFDKDGVAETPNKGQWDPEENNAHKKLRNDGERYIVNPVQTDPYIMCRPKHVVMMTDGFPEPERPDSDLANPLFVGSDKLNEAYGYVDWADRYHYDTAEKEIEYFVENSNLINVQPGSEDKFEPRVHVMGLNLADSSLESGQGDPSIVDVHEKLGRMAKAGKTCALHQLLKGRGKRYVPAAWGSFTVDGNTVAGTCNPSGVVDEDNAGNCLVQQLPTGDYTYKSETDCIAPAVLLEKNDRFRDADGTGVRNVRDDLTEALQLVFNEVISNSGGVASRTQVAITNNLDQLNERGQYRVFSGVDISGSSVYWQGLLERQTIACDDTAGTVGSSNNYSALHEEINLQVKEASGTPDGYLDNRRIFTSVAFGENASSGVEQAVLTDPSKTKLIANTGESVLFANYKMATLADTDDAFGDSARFGPSADAARVRVPFETAPLALAADYTTLGADEWNRLLSVSDAESGRKVVAEVRGRISGKYGRVLGPILNSTPRVVGPPELDLPISSYRAFKKKYAKRATVLYTSTLDGLLHAIYTGPNEGTGYGIIRRRIDGTEGTTGQETTEPGADVATLTGESQREAWAYAPEMLRNEYGANRGRQPSLLDGVPVVQDVRLCHELATRNQNEHACGTGDVLQEDQWRTVLVQGRGQSGSGYFALDITSAGGVINGTPNQMPDPIPLWEFDWRWEQRQILHMKSTGQSARYGYSLNGPSSVDVSGDCPIDLGLDIFFRQSNLDEYPYMGLSVSEAAIGTVVLSDVGTDPVKPNLQRPVAIFSAGLNGEIPGSDPCRVNSRRGRAIYVVDMQTGTLLRRFIDYFPLGESSALPFEVEMVGTPATYSSRPGTVSTRAFVGDAAGRLFRLDLTSTEPEDWKVDLFFDPCTESTLTNQAGSCDLLEGNSLADRPRPFGPASFRPGVALDSKRNLMVVYGLGERSDTSVNGQTQAMIALREKADPADAPDVAWATTFPEDPMSSPLREKLTGAPYIFNYGVYFTTFTEQKDDVCAPGLSRIWGLRLEPDASPGLDGVLDFRGAGTFSPTDIKFSNDAANELVRWYEPQQPALIRGVNIAFPPQCDITTADPTGSAGFGQSPPAPELIVSTGSAQNIGSNYDAASTSNDLSTGASGKLSFGAKKLAIPKEKLRALSWTILGD